MGSKLVIVMVGLPARGKSYITKKMTRYLNWLQHDTKIFNVGERRRVAASGHGFRLSSHSLEKVPSGLQRAIENGDSLPQIAAKILINGDNTAKDKDGTLSPLSLPSAARSHNDQDESAVEDEEHLEPPPRVEVTSPGPINVTCQSTRPRKRQAA